jgi:hypothetical protein
MPSAKAVTLMLPLRKVGSLLRASWICLCKATSPLTVLPEVSLAAALASAAGDWVLLGPGGGKLICVELAGAPVGGGLLDCGACPGDKASPQSSMQQIVFIVFIVCLLMQAHASHPLYASFLPFWLWVCGFSTPVSNL